MKTKNFIRKNINLLLFQTILWPICLNAQTNTINGTINIYTPVNIIDTTSCPANLTVEATSGFSVGDNVLIIQMKGAKFDTSNTSSFGSVINLNYAGNNEIAKISSISGNNVRLNGKLANKYSVAGKVQLIRIPNYINANVTGTLTCQAWNGKTGGVLILNVQNSLQLNANIDVSGKGFRGGIISKNPDGSCGNGSSLYHYSLYQPGLSWLVGGAQKGEGICDIDTARIAGRGPLVNGGGGGNKHNTGGGGGSNYTAGGKGGNGLEGCNAITGGIGGIDLSSYYTSSKLFAGGGGGCGDDNNGVGSTGENGGGIAIIIASSITGNGFKIKSNGNSVTVVGSSIADGAGGGGGGGAIFVNTNSVTNTIIETNGGDGGKQSPTWGCVGPGGGGGTGVILTNLSALTGFTSSQMPGAAGIVFGTTFLCNNTTYGAVSGVANSIGVLKNKQLIYTPDSGTSCRKVPTLLIKLDIAKVRALEVYPNPANTVIYWKNEIGKKVNTIRMYDFTNKVIFEKYFSSSTIQNLEIEMLKPGAYILEVNYEDFTQRGKFIKVE
jgi:hypothetical protein